MNRRKWSIGKWVQRHSFNRRKKERTFIVEVMDSIRDACGDKLWYRKVHGSVYGAGLPDILMIYNSHVFFLEFKRPGGKLSPRQKSTLSSIRKAGGSAYVLVATSRKTINVQEPPNFKTVLVITKSNGNWEGFDGLLGIQATKNIEISWP